MNNVDYLLRVQFSTLSLEDKFEIKRLGPHKRIKTFTRNTMGQQRLNVTLHTFH